MQGRAITGDHRASTTLPAPFAAAPAVAVATSRDGVTNDKTFVYAVGLWGDLPYSDLQATTGVPNLINDMNASKLDFSVHDGDLKAGNGTPGSTTPTMCVDALYTQALGSFNSLDSPAMFTTGDNDWTDCDRASNGGFNSLERLDHERQVFFSTSDSLGQHPIVQEVQSTPLCLSHTGQTACVENRRWTDPFAEAKANGSAAVMLISQADPGFDQTDPTRSPLRNPKTLVETDGQPDSFHDWLVAVRDETIAFRKPVAYVHGDSQGRRLENFIRVETFDDNQANGLNDVHWVKALVDPHSREVFAFQEQIVPGNRVAVPAPTP